MPQPDYTIRQNDSGEAITAILKDAAGDPVDLTDATVVFQLARIAGGGLVVEADAEFSDDGSDGGVSYTWQAEDTAAAGWYLASWRVTLDGAIQTYPLGTYTLVQIIGELGQVAQAGGQGSGAGVQMVTADRAPTEDDTGYRTGSFWFDTDGGDLWANYGDADDPNWHKLVPLPADVTITPGVVSVLNEFGGAELSMQGEGTGGQVDANVLIVNGVVDGSTSYLVSIRRGAVTDGDPGGDSWGVKLHGHEYLMGLDAPDDSEIADSERAQWFDDTVGAPAARFKERDSAGTLVSGHAVSQLDDGTIKLPGLPTADPHVVGQLWNSTGTLKVSAG